MDKRMKTCPAYILLLKKKNKDFKMVIIIRFSILLFNDF